MPSRKLGLTLLLFSTLAISAPWASSQPDGTVPAYNAAAPAKTAKLPPILAKDQLWGESGRYPYQLHAYELAAKVSSVIHQQPCYCYCDRMGHKSLRTCFESTHGAQCSVCMQELYYTYVQHKKGKTAAQIRKGIMDGEWKQVDLETATSIN